MSLRVARRTIDFFLHVGQIERGKRAEETKKVTVTIPTHVLKIVIDERTRRQIKSLRHATISELLVEAFLHAFTGQSLPTDEELGREE